MYLVLWKAIMNTNFLIRDFNKNSFISSYIFGEKTSKNAHKF